MILEMLHVLEDIHLNKLNGNRIYNYHDALQEGVRPKKISTTVVPKQMQ